MGGGSEWAGLGTGRGAEGGEGEGLDGAGGGAGRVGTKVTGQAGRLVSACWWEILHSPIGFAYMQMKEHTPNSMARKVG